MCSILRFVYAFINFSSKSFWPMLISASIAISILVIINPLIKNIKSDPADLFQSLYSLEFALSFYVLFSIIYLLNSDVIPITTTISQTFYRVFLELNLSTSILTIIGCLRDIFDIFLIVFFVWFSILFVYFNTIYKYEASHPQYYLSLLILRLYGLNLEDITKGFIIFFFVITASYLIGQVFLNGEFNVIW